MDYKDTEKELNVGAGPGNVAGKGSYTEYEEERYKKGYRDESIEEDDYEEEDDLKEDLEEDEYEEDEYSKEDSEEDDYEEGDDREEDLEEDPYDSGDDRRDNMEENRRNPRYRPHNYDLEEYEEDEYIRKKRTGDILFRIVAGILIFAICITAVVAGLLATGHLNGLIDKISEEETEAAPADSEPAVTPTVRVTLTPTPAATATPEPTATPKAEKTPTTAPDSSKTSEADTSGTDTAGVMTFHEVNDVVTAKETTNLRNVPSQGEESFIVYILQNGETVARTGMSDEGWSRLDYNGQVVYAMSNLLTTDLTKKEPTDSSTSTAAQDANSLPAIQTVFTDVNEQVTPKIEVNLRLLPSVTNPQATVIATIRNGEVVTRTGVNEELGWSRVEYNGQTLYCISSYVEPVAAQPAASEAATQEAAAPAA